MLLIANQSFVQFSLTKEAWVLDYSSRIDKEINLPTPFYSQAHETAMLSSKGGRTSINIFNTLTEFIYRTHVKYRKQNLLAQFTAN
jgi:hypothetical protein